MQTSTKQGSLQAVVSSGLGDCSRDQQHLQERVAQAAQASQVLDDEQLMAELFGDEEMKEWQWSAR